MGMTVLPDGRQEWRANGRLHRTDGPAVIWANGTQEWWINSRRHRTGGPAVIYADGRQEWWIDGCRHRTGGPAVIWANGRQEWRVGGKDITAEVEQWMAERGITWPFTPEECVEFILAWA